MKICFTSCMDATRVPHQPVWDEIRAHRPDVLLLLGDQIYMDWGLGDSGWREFIRTHPARGLAEFAQDMHQRYARQWSVSSFQRLIAGFTGRHDPARLLVTWDDHDFAWNNALGVDGDDHAHRHGVPLAVKHVSWVLHKQFVAQLRTAPPGTPYPELPTPLPPDPATVGNGLFWQGKLGGDTGVPALMLDTRWHRQARAKNAQLLGDVQTQALLSAATRTEGLLVVAAGTPMRHKYLLSQQAWHGGDGEPAYREYADLTRQAARPVLFLGGDIHRNAFGGRLPGPDGTRSAVLQVLSSGAAIGSFGPKRFAPSFGVADIQPQADGSGQVRLGLWALSPGGTWVNGAADSPLTYTRNNWVLPLDAEASADLQANADTHPLFILSSRQKRDAGAPLHQANDLNQLDPEFSSSEGLSADESPQPLTLQADASGSLQLVCATHSLLGGEGAQGVAGQVTQAFERALDAGKTAVVLFIHGFGKPFGASAAQAYELRASYPDCEPLLVTWAAGERGGVWASVRGLHDAWTSAKAGARGLAAVLRAFGSAARDPRYSRLTKVVVARSAGSVALNEALCTADAGFDGALDGVTRIVLSAPLLTVQAFNQRCGLGWLVGTPVVVTRNRHDQVLRLANWIDGGGDILGLHEPFHVRHTGAWCLDFTDSAWVGRLHDHLLPHINPAQHQLHQWLLTDARPFDPDHPGLQTQTRARSGRVVQVA